MGKASLGKMRGYAFGIAIPVSLFVSVVGISATIVGSAGSIGASFLKSLSADVGSGAPLLYTARILRDDQVQNQYNPSYQERKNSGTTKGTSKTRTDMTEPVQQTSATQPANECGKCGSGFICYQGACMPRAEVNDLQRQQEEQNAANRPKPQPTSPFGNVKGYSGGIQGPSNSIAQNIVTVAQDVTQGAQNIIQDTTHVIHEIINVPGSLENQQQNQQQQKKKSQGNAAEVRAPYCARNCIGSYACQPSLTGGTCVKTGGAAGSVNLQASGNSSGSQQALAPSLSHTTGRAVGLNASGTPVPPAQTLVPATEPRNTITHETATPTAAPSLSHATGSAGGSANVAEPQPATIPATETRNSVIAQQTPAPIMTPAPAFANTTGYGPSQTGGSYGTTWLHAPTPTPIASIALPTPTTVPGCTPGDAICAYNQSRSQAALADQAALANTTGYTPSNPAPQVVFVNPTNTAQYTVVNQQTLRSPEWQAFQSQVTANSVGSDVYSITNAVHQALPYNPDYAAYVDAANQAHATEQSIQKTIDALLGQPSASMQSKQVTYQGEVAVQELLNGASPAQAMQATNSVQTYLQPQNREFSTALKNKQEICWEQAIAEYMYLNSVGVKADIISVQNAGGADQYGTVLSVQVNGQRMILDPSNNIVAPESTYLKSNGLAQNAPVNLIPIKGDTGILPTPVTQP